MALEIVERFFEEAEGAGCETVVDPFVGSGTVVVEAIQKGFNAIGIDVNPWAITTTRAKINPVTIDIKNLREVIESAEPYIPSERLKKYHTEKQLRQLAKIRGGIEKLKQIAKPLALVALVATAEKHSLIKYSPAPKYRKNNLIENETQILTEFLMRVEQAIQDLAKLSTNSAELVLADSTTWLPQKIDAMLTSPPFANNVDYIRHSQLALLWAGYAKNSRELGRLRTMQIPSCEAAARRQKPQLNQPWFESALSNVGGKRKKGYRLFLAQYFYAIDKHLQVLAERLEWEAWYTVGNSQLGGAEIQTQEIMAKLAQKHGFKTKIEKIGVRCKPNRSLYLVKLCKKN